MARERSLINRPHRQDPVEVKTEGESDRAAESAHDPYKDNITVLVEPAILKTTIIGAGISANWVQIVRADEEGNPVGGGQDMWYME